MGEAECWRGLNTMNELLIIIFCIVHVAVHLKWKKIEYKILYYESAIILTVGLLGWILGTSLLDWDWRRGMFYVLTGSWDYPIQPIDLVFMGLSLLAATILLDFLTRFYDLDRTSLLAILPWTLTGQYRFLHEFVWVYHYWITMNVTRIHDFSDWIPWLENEKWIAPAFLTHTYAILLIIFSIFNFVVILKAFTKKSI